MSRFEFKLPDIGEGVTEGEVVTWLVRVGEAVEADQDVVEVMTDKATVTIGAPRAGTIVELRGAEGDGGPDRVFAPNSRGWLPLIAELLNHP